MQAALFNEDARRIGVTGYPDAKAKIAKANNYKFPGKWWAEGSNLVCGEHVSRSNVISKLCYTWYETPGFYYVCLQPNGRSEVALADDHGVPRLQYSLLVRLDADDTVDRLRASLSQASLEGAFQQLVSDVDPQRAASGIVEAMSA